MKDKPEGRGERKNGDFQGQNKEQLPEEDQFRCLPELSACYTRMTSSAQFGCEQVRWADPNRGGCTKDASLTLRQCLLESSLSAVW